MNDLNQMYASFLIEQKLRRHEDPYSDQIVNYLQSRRSHDGQPAFIGRMRDLLRLPSSRRRYSVVVPSVTDAKGTGSVS